MAAKKESEEEKEGTESQASGDVAKAKKKKLIIFAGAGVVLLLLAIGIPLMLMGGKGDKADGEEFVEEAEPEVVYKRAKLETFIVNLSDAKRFLKTTFLIEYDPSLLEFSEKGGSAHGGGGSGGHGAPADPTALPPQIKDKEAQVRDAVIHILSSKRADDLLTVQGKQSLKEELIEAINTALDFPDPPVVGIYFIEFIIQ